MHRRARAQQAPEGGCPRGGECQGGGKRRWEDDDDEDDDEDDGEDDGEIGS